MNYVYRYCGYYGSTDFKECVRGLENCDIVNLTEEMLEGFSEDRLKIWQDSFDYYLSVLETEYNYDLEHAMSILNIKSVHVRETALVEQSHLIKDGRLIDPNDLDPDLLTFEGVRYKYRD